MNGVAEYCVSMSFADGSHKEREFLTLGKAVVFYEVCKKIEPHMLMATLLRTTEPDVWCAVSQWINPDEGSVDEDEPPTASHC